MGRGGVTVEHFENDHSPKEISGDQARCRYNVAEEKLYLSS